MTRKEQPTGDRRQPGRIRREREGGESAFKPSKQTTFSFIYYIVCGLLCCLKTTKRSFCIRLIT